MHEHEDDPVRGFHLKAHITAQAVAILTELDPFEHGLEGTATSWINMWCRGDYATESIDRLSWPVEGALFLSVCPQAYARLVSLGASLGRTPDNIASTIVNQRAANLAKRKKQGCLLSTPTK